MAADELSTSVRCKCVSRLGSLLTVFSVDGETAEFRLLFPAYTFHFVFTISFFIIIKPGGN